MYYWYLHTFYLKMVNFVNCLFKINPTYLCNKIYSFRLGSDVKCMVTI